MFNVQNFEVKKKMFEKYIMIKETKIVCGQNATTGGWYCKELPADTIKDMDIFIGEISKILNKHNKKEKHDIKKEEVIKK